MSLWSRAPALFQRSRSRGRNLRDHPHLRFFVFTSRNPESDFRRPLVDALRRHCEVYYIWMRRRPVISGPDGGTPASSMSVAGLVKFLLGYHNLGITNVYFDSTDTCFPALMLFLRLAARPGVWCLDMHDDLRYYFGGWRRIRQNAVISLLGMTSHAVLRAAPALSELFPKSHLLGNASHILPLPHEGVDLRDVLILTSFDARFDFDFLLNLAALSPQTRFHIHGWTRNSDPGTLQCFSRLVNEHANVLYHGPYATDDLPSILKSYGVTVAPYRANSQLTRYIDPLRFYHCLNAGLHVVSTDIPQARCMERWIHVVRDAEHCAEILKLIQAGNISKQQDYAPITWDQRSIRLMDIVRPLST